MPNQPAKAKRRKIFAEHRAVLAALSEIARLENTTVNALRRDAVRDLIRKRVTTQTNTTRLREVVWSNAPRMPARFRTAAQVARFKRAQREFDQLVIDLNFAQPSEIQERNSIVPPGFAVRILEFEGGGSAKQR